MKKRLSLITLLLIVLLPTNAFAQDIKIVVNNQEVQSDVAPYIENGRTMVPVRFISEALNGHVQYDPAGTTYPIESITITANNDDLWLSIFPNHRGALRSEAAFLSDSAPVIKNNRTMVPLRFIADYLGCSTSWDEKTKTVNINTINSDSKLFSNYYNDELSQKIDNLLFTGDLSAKSFSNVLK